MVLKTTLRDEPGDPRGNQAAGCRWKFDVNSDYRLAEAGVLRADDRAELIEGGVVAMGPIGSRHGGVNKRLVILLTSLVAGRTLFGISDPVRLDNHSEPQPDVSVLHLKRDFYGSDHPAPADVFFLIEVMDSSALYDRGVKLGAYARAKVAEVWLVDLTRECIEVYRHPDGETFAEKHTFSRGQALSPGSFPDVVLAVDAVLG